MSVNSLGAKQDTQAPAGRNNISACVRCRQKKKRCDQRLPSCRLCENAGVECIGYDAVTRKQIPRSYVRGLEERVAFLEAKLRDQQLGSEGTETSAPSSNKPLSSRKEDASPATHSGPTTVVSVAVDDVRNLTQHKLGQESSFSAIFLAEILAARLHPQVPRQEFHSVEATDCLFSEYITGDGDDNTISLPPKAAAQNLVKEFFECASLGMPLLHEPTFQRKFDHLYGMPQTINIAETHVSVEARLAIFFVFEVFAVGVLSIQKHDPSRLPTWLADRYHKTAIAALLKAGLPSNVEGVQALLLVGIYSYHHPIHWASWKTIGAAVRLAVELGLHQDPSSNDLDFLTLDTMRRTFWVAYAMDRNISISLTLPSCLSDGVITAKFPSNIEDALITEESAPAADALVSGSKTISIHLFKYRQIQSEMQRVLYESPPLPYSSVDLDWWQQQMHDRIQGWYTSRPQTNNLSVPGKGVVDTFEVTYHTALFYLFRPSLNIPCPSAPQLLSMAHASINMIELYRRFFCERQLTIYWQAMENLSSAGICLMFGYVHSPDVQQYLTFRSLESLVRNCSSVLWGMVERFPSFQGKRDAFDKVASRVLADLSATAEQNGTLSTPTESGQGDQSRSEGQAIGTILQSGVASVGGVLPMQNLPMPGFLSAEGTNGSESLPPLSLEDLNNATYINWEATLGPDGLFMPGCLL